LTKHEAAEGAAEDELQTDQDRTTDPGQAGPDQTDPSAANDIEALRAEVEESRNRALRFAAEIENLRKRSARDIENARKYGAERLAAALLPVRDSLEAALEAGAAGDAGLDVATLIEGDRATLRLLDQALEGAGLAEIDPHGEPFDPERHEAMSMLPSPTAEPNSVINVVQKGYVLHDRVVRPARVIVAQPPSETDGQ
jgi:molecular chaperone GrpE